MHNSFPLDDDSAHPWSDLFERVGGALLVAAAVTMFALSAITVRLIIG